MYKKLSLTILSFLLLNITIAQSQLSPRLVQQTKTVLTAGHGILTVHAIQKVGNQYVIMDRHNVVYTDLLFNKQKTFDFEACHPGSPFNPNRISRVGKKHLIIASTPVLSYLVNLETHECTNRAGASSRFIPEYMTHTESGFLNLLKRGEDLLDLASYTENMTTNYMISFKDEYPFNSLRFRLRVGNSILKLNDGIIIMNGSDFSVMRIKDSEIKNKTYKVDVLAVPIPNVNKPIFSGKQLSDMTEIHSILSGMHFINATYFGKGYNLLFDVRDMSKQANSLYMCNYDSSGISDCTLLKHLPRGEEIRYAENGEVVTIKWTELSDGEYEQELTKYTIH